MQRIKSQSTCQITPHIIGSQSRPRSKKNTKGQNSETSNIVNERNKISNIGMT